MKNIVISARDFAFLTGMVAEHIKTVRGMADQDLDDDSIVKQTMHGIANLCESRLEDIKAFAKEVPAE